VYLATVPGLLHEESSRVRDWGDNMRTDSVVRGDRYGVPQVPAHDRRDGIPLGPGCQYTSEQLARHLKGYGTRPSVGRAGVCWAESFNATLKNERVYQMVHHRKKQDHPGYCLPGRARYTRSEMTPLRPGVQDAGRGRPGPPSNTTNSPRHHLQNCPRHARQPSSGFVARFAFRA